MCNTPAVHVAITSNILKYTIYSGNIKTNKDSESAIKLQLSTMVLHMHPKCIKMEHYMN